VNILFNLAGKLLGQVKYYRYRLRIQKLIAGGLVLGKNVTIQPSVSIDEGYPYLIRIGNNCSLSNEVRLLVHDATTFKFTDGYTRLSKIEIKDNCFIGERVVILPGVTIGPHVLVAAGSVVYRDIPPNSCAAGVPARVYAKFDDFLYRHKKQIEGGRVLAYSKLHPNTADPLRREIQEVAQSNNVYVKGYSGKYPYTWNH